MGGDTDWGSCLATIKTEGTRAVLSPNDLWVAAGSKSELKLWDVATAVLVCTIELDHVQSITFSLDSTLLALALDNGTIKVYNVTAGGELVAW